MKKRSPFRVIRDPIQGDILLGDVATAIVDTRLFQRLRYIRQNGLLHFVFPGAVHTRFSHSLGTMALAQKVGRNLFGDPQKMESKKLQRAAVYVTTIFELAALLHDIGHTAFSHSIENILIEGKPIFGTLRERFESWHEDELLGEYESIAAHDKRYEKRVNGPLKHEQLGLVFVRRIFDEDSVRSKCKKVLGQAADDVGRDVRAVMDGGLDCSSAFQTAVDTLVPHLKSTAHHFSGDKISKIREPASDVLEVLHNLVSGTLDVDRLDYLARDSVYCGVPYGKCNTDLLIRSLSFGILAGKFILVLDEKATNTLEDMLWSRYQLFVQVYNHKTNIGLDRALATAMEDAIGENVIVQPDSVEDFTAFTDDYVMSSVVSQCAHGKKLAGRSYTRALVDRQLPRYLGFEPYPRKDSGVARILKMKAQEHGLETSEVFYGEAKSHFIKAAELPRIVKKDRATGEIILSSWEKRQSATPMRSHLLHFFSEHQMDEL